MTAAANLYRSFGEFELPVAASTASDLASLDPARDILLDLFGSAIVAELSPVWRFAVAGTTLGDLDGQEASPVRMKLPSMPSPEALGEMAVAWPLLCVSRAPTPAAQFGDLTLERRMLTQRWDVDYILAPLTIGNLLRVQDILQAVGKTIDLVIENGGHPAYRTVQNGNQFTAARVLGSGENCCGFWQCRVTEMALGPASFAPNGPKYYACGLTLETLELSDFAKDANGEADDGEAVPLIDTTATFGLSESGDPSIIVRG